jgi:hypothetical protein
MIGPTRLGPNRLGPIRPGMRVVAFVAAVLIALVVGAPPATGHEDGQVQLYAAEMTVTPDSDGQRIDVLLVDLDSGSPAPGFAAGVTGIGPDGSRIGPIELSSSPEAHYRASVALAPGNWTFTVDATQGSSVTGAVASQRSFALSVAAPRTPPSTVSPASTPVSTTPVSTTPPAGSSKPSTAPASLPPVKTSELLTLDVDTDPSRQAGLSANYVAIIAHVRDAATGAAVSSPYTLRAVAIDAQGIVDSTTFHLAYPFGDDPSAEPGAYTGVVIVPRGGTWTIMVNAFDPVAARRDRIPVALASASVSLDVVGGALLGSGVRANQSPTRADSLELVHRILHGFVGLAWFALAGILALVGWRDASTLGGSLGAAIVRNSRRLTGALLWITAAMWLSGIINLKSATAFAPPLSGKQATQLFRVPYARPYIYTLYLKIAVYAILTALVWPIVKRSKSMAEGAASGEKKRNRAITVPLALALGGAIILTCVSILSYVHVLSERVPPVGR